MKDPDFFPNTSVDSLDDVYAVSQGENIYFIVPVAKVSVHYNSNDKNPWVISEEIDEDGNGNFWDNIREIQIMRSREALEWMKKKVKLYGN